MPCHCAVTMMFDRHFGWVPALPPRLTPGHTRKSTEQSKPQCQASSRPLFVSVEDWVGDPFEAFNYVHVIVKSVRRITPPDVAQQVPTALSFALLSFSLHFLFACVQAGNRGESPLWLDTWHPFSTPAWRPTASSIKSLMPLSRWGTHNREVRRVGSTTCRRATENLCYQKKSAEFLHPYLLPLFCFSGSWHLQYYYSSSH